MRTAPIHPDAPAAVPSASGAWLRALGSLRLTLVILLALAGAVLLTYLSASRSPAVLAIPLAAAAINLLAAIATHPVFRRRLPLLVFHLCLLAIVLLALVGRLTALRGTAEVTDGTWFEGQASTVDAGPWHGDGLQAVRFSSEGFRIEYQPGLRRGPTRNTVHYIDPAGLPRRTEIGDQTPLVIDGYRFYTSHNKGFAPTFAWLPADGSPAVLGSVHLPAYPLHEYRQAQAWTLPGGGEAWTMLVFDENLLDPERPGEFRLPTEHSVVLRVGDRRWELGPGGEVALAGGRLRYLGLRGWMGYTIHYDPTLPWLLAAAVAAVLALAAHFAEKFRERPWNP